MHLDPDGKLTKSPSSPSAKEGAVRTLSDTTGFVSPDGYAVNTMQPPYQPSNNPPAIVAVSGARGSQEIKDAANAGAAHAIAVSAALINSSNETLSVRMMQNDQRGI